MGVVPINQSSSNQSIDTRSAADEIARQELPEGLSFVDARQWQEFVGHQAAAMPFHHRAWIELLADQYRLNPVFAVRQDSQGQIFAGVPFLSKQNAVGSTSFVSLSFSDWLPILATDQSAHNLLIESLSQFGRDTKASIILRTDNEIDSAAVGHVKYRHEINTLGTQQDILARLHPVVRRRVRGKVGSRLEFRIGSEFQDLESFYQLHLLTRQKLGVPIQPRSFFSELYDRIVQQGLGAIAIVSHQGEPVAGAIIFEFNHRAIVKYAASNPRQLGLRPNDYLFFRLSDWARESGHVSLGLGTTELHQEGLRVFKMRMGCCESFVFHNFLSGPITKSGRDTVAAKLISHIVKRSPRFVCQWVGEKFYGFSQ